MRTTCKIAKNELALLFFSPIAWFLLVAFLFQCGLAYTGAIGNILTQQDLGGRGLKYLGFLTAKIYVAPPFGIWPGLAQTLYLYLPLLTMGLMSREINSGTIKLLYSSPIRVREIIFGKFLAMTLYNLMLVAVLLLTALCGLSNIHAPDMGLLLAGLLGFFLLLNTYAAIGLFMSCLTAYQVVAALSTMVLLAVLSYIGNLWRGVDFVRDLTWFLSINGRTDQMMQGLITTKDLLYFLVIMGIFLSFSICKLQSDRESVHWTVKAARYTVIMVIALALGYLSSRPGLIGYLDTTATKTMTLTANSQKIVKELDDQPIEVTSYINLLDARFWNGRPEDRNYDLARWEPYLRFKSNIRLKYVYFYDSTGDKDLFSSNPGKTMDTLAKEYARSFKVNLKDFKTPAEMHQLIDLRPEENRYVMQLRYKGRTTFLRLFDDDIIFPSETETDAALKRLMKARLPKIAFVKGELERSIDKIGDRHYKTLTNQINFRNSLVNQGFDVETISLKDQDLPADITALVIADPKLDFDTTAILKLQLYIAAGGNLLIAGEPGKQAILNPLLKPLGVRIMDGMLVQRSKDFAPNLIQPYLTATAAGLTKAVGQDAADSQVVSMNGAAALAYDTTGPFTITPFVMTPDSVSWNKKDQPNQDQLDEDENANTDVTAQKEDPARQSLIYSPAQGDQGGPLPVILGLTRNINGKQQRIVVAGDADFLSNAELRRENIQTCNFDLSTAFFSWFSYEEFPIDTSRPPSRDNMLNITDKGLYLLKILLLWVLPGLGLGFGTVLLVRRRRK